MLWITVERPRRFGVCIVYNDAIESSRYPGEQNILDGAPIQNGVKTTYSVLFSTFPYVRFHRSVRLGDGNNLKDGTWKIVGYVMIMYSL